MSRRGIILGLLLPVAGACSLARGGLDTASEKAPVVSGGAQLVEAMRERYEGRWFRTLMFLQNNTRYGSDGREEKSQWMEYLSVPGKLRIEFMPRTSGSGILFTNGRAHTFEGGSRVDQKPQVHPLILLTGDVYVLPASVTLRRLDSLGVDLSRFREDRWEGRRVYVAGASSAGDTLSSQFWVDVERMLLVRWIESQGTGARRTASDTRLSGYRNIDGHPIATEMTVYRGGKLVFKESYSDVRVNVPFSPTLFDPSRWKTALHPESR